MIKLLRDSSGASAAEFAMVLPLLLIFLFGIIDGGRIMWTWNQAEKATQVGARVAIVTDILPPGVAAASYVGVDPENDGTFLTQGDVIPAAALGKIECINTGCTCVTTPCPSLGTFNTTNFNLIVQRMTFMKPDVKAANVRVIYRGSGLGFAGDPNGTQIQPLVTVELRDLTFKPLTMLALKSVNLPTFSTTLTGEDLSGTTFN